MVLIGSSLRAAAESTVTELSLEDGGVQRVLFISPANPSAILIMLPGGNGTVDFGPGGTLRDSSVLVRTLPLWAGAGLCSRRSLLAQRYVLNGVPPHASLRWGHRTGGGFRPQPGEPSGLVGWDEPGSHRRGRRRRPDRWQDRRYRRDVLDNR